MVSDVLLFFYFLAEPGVENARDCHNMMLGYTVGQSNVDGLVGLIYSLLLDESYYFVGMCGSVGWPQLQCAFKLLVQCIKYTHALGQVAHSDLIVLHALLQNKHIVVWPKVKRVILHCFIQILHCLLPLAVYHIYSAHVYVVVNRVWVELFKSLHSLEAQLDTIASQIFCSFT